MLGDDTGGGKVTLRPIKFRRSEASGTPIYLTRCFLKKKASCDRTDMSMLNILPIERICPC